MATQTALPFPMNSDDSRVRALAEKRVDLLRGWLESRGYDGILISRRDNFAWLTVGGDNHVLKPTEIGVGHLLITGDQKYLLAYTMDGERILTEEVPGQGYQLETVRWHDDEPRLRAIALAGKRVAADTPLPGTVDCSLELSRMHTPFDELERDRYRWLAHQTGLVLEKVARTIRPGLTEQEIARRITFELMAMEMDVDVLLVGSDERVERIRHVVPSSKTIERYVLFNPTARRWGLHANISRAVSFGQPKENLRRAFNTVMEIQSKILAKLEPGLPYSDLLDSQKLWYAEAGYAEEWHRHFQGGTTGYIISDAGLGLTNETIKDNQAFDYFVTLPGVMVEELVLLWNGQLQVASRGCHWPVKKFSVNDRTFELPELWIM
jgi:Xaa-Pro dipeptidase